MFQGAYDYYSIFVIYFEREARSSDICPACNLSQARFLRPLINQQESRQVQVVMMGAVAGIMFFITLQYSTYRISLVSVSMAINFLCL